MTTLLSAQSVSYDITSGPLFEGISFTLQKGDRIGLIGNNGCGKSTLLKLLNNELSLSVGEVSLASQCRLARVEQHLPEHLKSVTMLEAVVANLPPELQQSDEWRAKLLLSDIGFDEQHLAQPIETLSGGQHARVLMARALIVNPDVLLLDEPSNHLDLPTLLWLEQFLHDWKGTFILVSHDQRLLDRVTNCTWIMRDKTLYFFRLICSEARRTLVENDRTDALRYNAEQKEIDRISKSAKRLAVWGRDFDNEKFARKAKTMEKRAENLKANQTQLGGLEPWTLSLSGEPMQANRLLVLDGVPVPPAPDAAPLFDVLFQQIKSGDRVAVMGKNGTGKSSLLRLLWQNYQSVVSDANSDQQPLFHAQARLGYYDQSLAQLDDGDSLLDALYPFYPHSQELRKMKLISAGFPYTRHSQRVRELSGGERSRLLFVGLSLANYHFLMLDEPTNHLDIEGKEELAETLNGFEGGLLLVSHDRELVEKSCNRFWYIAGGKLTEMNSLAHINEAMLNEAKLSEQPSPQRLSGSSPQGAMNSGLQPPVDTGQDALLERLFALEELLSADFSRKKKYQKPAKQSQWQVEISAITAKLDLD